MDVRRLARTDLNLLVAFQVLLEEQHVSNAAERLFITQSAMSKTLSRLRELFDDPLFTRSAHGMVPTPRAIELHGELEHLLQQMDYLMSYHEADPTQFQGKISITATDHFALPLMPSLMGRISEEAPGISVRVSQDIDSQFRDMTEGRVDVAVGGQRSDIEEDFIVETLCVTYPVFLMRHDHPLKELEKPSWRDIMQYPEVSLKVLSSQGSRGSILRSRVYRYMKLSTTVLETPDYLTALETLSRTDAIMFAPRLSQDFVKATGAISSIALPGREGRDPVEVVMIFHKRTENSSVHKWIREQIKDIYAVQQQRFDQRQAN
ncbi:MAG: LysR family transcriptional regulator [Porticoccaceae bacterium]|jgi:DNA-binding transcriptional LysR family regulator|nr:LysR family transcriptional regulator [Porticoccaceae bacterium]